MTEELMQKSGTYVQGKVVPNQITKNSVNSDKYMRETLPCSAKPFAYPPEGASGSEYADQQQADALYCRWQSIRFFRLGHPEVNSLVQVAQDILPKRSKTSSGEPREPFSPSRGTDLTCDPKNPEKKDYRESQ